MILRRYKHECSECRTPTNGITCSTKCRKRRQRRRHEVQSAFPLVMSEMGKIRDSVKRREDLAQLIEQLKRIKGEVNDLLLMAGDQDAVNRHTMVSEILRKRTG